MDLVEDQFVELAVEIFKMLADTTRVRIVLALRGGELSVNTLADVVGKSPPSGVAASGEAAAGPHAYYSA